MWRQFYRSNENIDFEEELLDDEDSVQEDEKNEIISIVSSKINEDHIKKMNRIFKKQPHLAKMFMNEKLEKEKKEKEQQDKNQNKHLQEEAKKKLFLLKKQQEEKLEPKLKPVQNIMSPQIMEKFQEFLKFQKIQSEINQLPFVPLEIKTFHEFTDTNKESVKDDKKTEIIIKQNRPLNLTKQRQSLLNILNKKKK